MPLDTTLMSTASTVETSPASTVSTEDTSPVSTETLVVSTHTPGVSSTRTRDASTVSTHTPRMVSTQLAHVVPAPPLVATPEPLQVASGTHTLLMGTLRAPGPGRTLAGTHVLQDGLAHLHRPLATGIMMAAQAVLACTLHTRAACASELEASVPLSTTLIALPGLRRAADPPLGPALGAALGPATEFALRVLPAPLSTQPTVVCCLPAVVHLRGDHTPLDVTRAAGTHAATGAVPRRDESCLLAHFGRCLNLGLLRDSRLCSRARNQTDGGHCHDHMRDPHVLCPH